MHRSSESIGTIAAALAKAQSARSIGSADRRNKAIAPHAPSISASIVRCLCPRPPRPSGRSPPRTGSAPAPAVPRPPAPPGHTGLERDNAPRSRGGDRRRPGARPCCDSGRFAQKTVRSITSGGWALIRTNRACASCHGATIRNAAAVAPARRTHAFGWRIIFASLFPRWNLNERGKLLLGQRGLHEFEIDGIPGH
jgi:hypothetical protein